MEIGEDPAADDRYKSKQMKFLNILRERDEGSGIGIGEDASSTAAGVMGIVRSATGQESNEVREFFRSRKKKRGIAFLLTNLESK